MLVNIYLEARNPESRCSRAYHITMERDLFGVFLVETRFGRIGSLGRTLAKSFPEESQARSFIDKCLRKRQTAPKRIGAKYEDMQQLIPAAARASSPLADIGPMALCDEN